MHSIQVLRRTLSLLFLMGSAGLATAQDAKGISNQAINIGTTIALTGPLSQYGIPIRAGTAAYVSMINDRGGVNNRKIQLLTEDNAFQTPQALAAVRKMVSGDGIFALINSMGTAQVAALLPYMIEQQKIPIFGTYGGLIDWFSPPRQGLFGLQVLYEDQARVLGRWAGKDGHKKVLAVHIEGASFARAAQEVEPGFRTASPNGSVELLGVKLPTSDYAPIAIKVAQVKPDALIVMLTEAEILLFTKELQNQRLQVPIYTWSPAVTAKVVEIGGPAVEGMKAISWTVSPLDDTPAVKEYRDALAKYWPSEKPDFVSLFNFGQTKLFVEALSRMKAGSKHSELYDALYSLKSFETGILPPVTFSAEKHQGITSIYQSQVSNGQWKIGSAVDSANRQW